jgi:RNA polymerase sigma-70 factor (ECF subfamily)
MTDTAAQTTRIADPDGLARRFRGVLLRYFQRRLGSRVEAEDLTQEVFVRILQRNSEEPIEKVGSFIFTAAANLMRDHVRTQGARPKHVQIEEGASPTLLEDCAPDRVLIGRERLAEVLACLDELPARTRAAFLMFRVERMRQREIGRAMGISTSAVEKHIARATAHLVQRLMRDASES